LISKGLGIGIIAGSVLVKVPQIVKIYNAKSADGISIFSVLIDLMAITFHISYSFVSGFTFSAWGDGTFLAIQTAIIAALVFLYGHKSALKSIIFLIAYSIVTYVLMGGMTPLSVLWKAQGFNVPLLMTGKLSQALTNYKNGSTGQLSAVTCFMMFAGALARIFTSIQETGDTMMIVTYCASTFANAVIVAQVLYYWNKPIGPAIVAKDVDRPKKPMRAKKAD
jgi:mannose-P-dolichol utilization defect 1